MNIRRRLLLPLVPIYRAVLACKRRLFKAGRLKLRRLDEVVISVGSLSAGGAGKTPVVLMLAEMLRSRNYAVRILTRGYGRESDTVERVDPGGDPRRFGDEPVLLARRSGAPVYVGADRYKAGLMGRGEPTPDKVIYLLDDGFQHRQLGRDIDLVLLTREDVEDTLLPAGNLREPLSMLSDADVIVVREEEAESMHGFLSGLGDESGPVPIWQVRRRLLFPSVARGPLPDRLLAFCGIARPDGFTGMLQADGIRPVAAVTFADHHMYEERDVSRLIEQAERTGANGFVTTEKDAVKLSGQMRNRLGSVGPLVIAELHVELVDEKCALEQMISIVAGLDRRKVR